MSHEQLLQAATQDLIALKRTREERVGRAPALVGDGAGNLVGNNGSAWVLCRLGGDVNRLVQAYNGTPLTPSEGMGVTLLVKYREGRVDHYEIEKQNGAENYPTYLPGQSGWLAAHAISHEIGRGDGQGGWDALNVYERMFTSLRPNAQSTPDLTVYVAAGYYNIAGTEYYFAGGSTGAFTPPGSGSEYDVVTLDASGALNIQTSALTSPPVAFSLPSDEIPIVAVYLTAGQTSIVESNLLDIRPFLSLSSPTTPFSLTVKEVDGSPSVADVTTIRVSNGTLTDDGGGQVTIVTRGLPHDLLDGDIDQDTVAHTVVRGDLIVGNSTPKWAALTLGAANRVLRSDGTDALWALVALATDVTGTLSIANGGTGQTSATAAFNALSPQTTRGDLITRDATNDVRLGIGASGKILQSDGTDPAWQAVSGDAALASGGALTLANSGVTAATYGDATHVAQVTVDAKGRITAASNVAISGGAGCGEPVTNGDPDNPEIVFVDGDVVMSGTCS